MPHRTESKTSPRRIEAVNKQRQALELRMAGWHYDVIAQRLGYKSHNAALYAVNAALRKTLQPVADNYRELTLERLTKVLNTWWTPMLNHDPQATDKVLAAITDIRQLLGLDAPVKQQVTGADGKPLEVHIDALDEIIRRISQQATRSGETGDTPQLEAPTG